jgi:hypothetical protein
MASTETLGVPTTTSVAAASASSTTPKAPSRILFGSCSSQHYEQVLWPSIIHRNATAFVWGGDAIYGEYGVGASLTCAGVLFHSA